MTTEPPLKRLVAERQRLASELDHQYEVSLELGARAAKAEREVRDDPPKDFAVLLAEIQVLSHELDFLNELLKNQKIEVRG